MSEQDDVFANGKVFLVILGFVLICLFAWANNKQHERQDNVDNLLRRRGVPEQQVQDMRQEYEDYNRGYNY